MLWVYGYYILFYSYSAGIDFRRQNLILTSKVDPRTVRVDTSELDSEVCYVDCKPPPKFMIVIEIFDPDCNPDHRQN